MTQEVFDFFDREHGLILLESEYDDIQRVVNEDLYREIIVWKNSYSSANAQLAEARAMVAELDEAVVRMLSTNGLGFYPFTGGWHTRQCAAVQVYGQTKECDCLVGSLRLSLAKATLHA